MKKIKLIGKGILLTFLLVFSFLFYEANSTKSATLAKAELAILETRGITPEQLVQTKQALSSMPGIQAIALNPSYAAITYNPMQVSKNWILTFFKQTNGSCKEAKFQAKESKCPVHQWLPYYQKILNTLKIN